MIDPEAFFAPSPDKAPSPAASPIPGSDADLAARLFGPSSDTPKTFSPPKGDEELANKLFGDGPPDKYLFTVPQDLSHLGLVHDEAKHSEFSVLAKSMGLSQARAQELVNHHLRAAYGGKKK